jgi:hypothetical protein
MVVARTARQQALSSRETPPDIHVILDEAAIRRQVGGPGITRRQLQALATASALPHVTLQVLPLSSGRTLAWTADSPSSPSPTPRTRRWHTWKGLMGDVYLESETELDVYNLAWTHLVSQAMARAESAAMISDLAKETT